MKALITNSLIRSLKNYLFVCSKAVKYEIYVEPCKSHNRDEDKADKD